jgi:hypothetical protein
MPDLNVTKDTAVTADMRTAKPVNVALTGEPTARPTFTATAWHLGADVNNVFAGSAATYTTTIGSPANDFGFQVRATYVQPMVSMRVVGGDEQPVSRSWAGGLLLGDHQAPLVNGGNGSPQDLAKVTVKGSIVLIWPDGDPGPAIAALADGGALAVLLPQTYFGLSPTALPILSTPGPAAARALIAALAKQTLTVRTHGIRNSPYQYELVFHRNGGMPDGATYQSRKEDLAAVRAHYHHAGGDAIASTPNMATPTGGVRMYGGTPRIWLPADRVNYFTPDAVTWNEQTYLGDFTGPLQGIYDVKAPSTYAVRRPYTEDWLAAATGNRVSTPFLADPTGNAIPWAYRSGDTVTVALPSLSDSNPSHLGFAIRPDTGSTVLTRGATEIGRTSAPGSGVFTVPAGPDTYQLSSQTQREFPTYWVLSTDVHAVWTFTSAHIDGTERRPLPLLDVDLRLPVDLANSLPARGPSEVEISVGAQPGTSTPTVRHVEIDVSYDGGSTWQHGTVQGSGTAYRASLPGGGTPGGFAALHAKVTDASGATIEETIIRAYMLR